ncbi:thioesterase II family protein [Streptomonospora litoralis]|uniref:Linear gramicidin dehydrogenase LgrE n=1 Tax=Streptomonospora litoralis TaxID=2498135 RepID=A0A4P6Q3S4_9ACTN|nr:alpha/beta fold hydrolase [Streptomonospora litoralis]QBI54870.1 Linear gramicidin dehydrogenase LgrE [Streptomonospora litoralis]
MNADLWLRSFHTAEEGAARLVFFPHAGGAASYFFPLSKLLAPQTEVLAVQYPGRQDRHRERPLDDVSRLADELREVLRPADDTPVVYFGHSLGATVAFEVARRLEEEGAGPRMLMASARCAPSAHRSDGIHLLDDAGIVAELRRLSGTDPSLLEDEELLAALMPAIRGDYTAAETYAYEPGAPLSCPVVGFVGDDDVRVGAEDLAGWREHTSAGFELCRLPGGHFYPTEDPTRAAKEIGARVGSAVSPRGRS